MALCKFKEKYFDFEKNQTELFKCDEEAEHELCPFHDKNYDSVKKSIMLDSKIKEAVEKSLPLFCIGYILSEITIKEAFSKPVYFTKASIASINVEDSNFREADFSGAIIDRQSNFINTVFLLSDFIKTVFKEGVSFKNSKFLNGVNFSGSDFQGFADFAESNLVGPIFIGTEFQKVNFSLTEIESGEFNMTKIKKNSNFIGTSILKTSFTQAKFSEMADFTGAEIKKSDFIDTQFESVNFSESSQKVIEYVRTIFKKMANFERAKMEKIEFIQSKMEGNTNFSETNLEEIGFGKTKFMNRANFTKAHISKKANFKFCEFKNVVFDDVRFKIKAEFNFAKFGNASFKGTIFEESDFSNVEFGENGVFFNSEFKKVAKFNSVLFEKPQHVIFDVKDLSMMSFLNTDISEIRFGKNVHWGEKDGFTLVDETRLESFSEQDIESLLAEYRSLRENYERRCRKEDAEKILRHEVELQKKIKVDISPIEPHILERKVDDLTRKYHELKKMMRLLEEKVQKND
jgi:uncharacterized protein YjbI with pentapeptide repeats